MDDWKRLSGVSESTNDELSDFATKRGAGAEKISDGAKKKGGVALLTHHHFRVKKSYYDKVSGGVFDFGVMKKEYIRLCSELHSYMKNIEDMDQIEFQELVGKIEVVGELLIQKRS